MNKNNRLMFGALFCALTGMVTVYAAGPDSINLGTAGNFTVLAKSGISTTGATSITGNIGVSPAAATFITGFGFLPYHTLNPHQCVLIFAHRMLSSL